MANSWLIFWRFGATFRSTSNGGLSCPPAAASEPAAKTRLNDGSEQQRAHPTAPHSRRNQRIVHQLFDERDRLSRAARRARWTQASASSSSLRYERAWTRSRSTLQKVGDSRR